MKYTLYTPECRPEVNNEPSRTIPDMSRSLSQIVREHRIGVLPASLVRNVLYDESDDFDSVLAEYSQGFDLVDKQRELLKLRQKFYAMRQMPDPRLSSTSSQSSVGNSVSSDTSSSDSSSAEQEAQQK